MPMGKISNEKMDDLLSTERIHMNHGNLIVIAYKAYGTSAIP